MKKVFFWFLVPFVYVARLSFITGLALFARRQPQPPFDVIHVHDSGWLAGVGVWLGHKWGIPVFCKEATAPALNPVSYGTPFRRYWEKMRSAADGWSAQTDNIRGQLIAAGIPVDRVFLVPNGVCIPDAAGVTSDHDGVLYVGNLTQGSEWKAFDVLFDAWVQVVHRCPEAKLVFVGAGDPTSWMQYLKAADALHSVEFTGRVDDPALLYASTGIFILPSRVEGMSNALLEAQSWGRACVVSDIPGNSAVVKNDVNGLVVPVNDSRALAESVIRLLEDKELRQRLGGAARSNMIENYNITLISERVAGIYQRLFAGTAA